MATILIVDDRGADREQLLALLGDSGHQFLQAADGAEAYDVVRVRKPGLVISDIMMPKVDGLAFLQKLRADADLGVARTPVIFSTAIYDQAELIARARELGVSSVLPKPCKPAQLLAAVSQALDGAKAGRAGAAPAKRKSRSGRTNEIDDTLKLYVKDLQSDKANYEAIASKSATLRSERARLKEISGKFTWHVARLQSVSSRLSALLEVVMKLMQERKPERLVKLFFGAACEIIDSKFAAIGILEGEQQQSFSHLVTKGFEVGVHRGRGGEGFPGALLPGQGALRLRGAAAELQPGRLPPGHPPVRSFLGVPIASREQRYGWLYFADRTGAGEFSEEDERLAAILAANLALLYENATLYDSVQRHAARLQVEALQRKLMEQAAQESELKYRAIFENSIEGIFQSTREGRLIACNPAHARIMGYQSPEELLAAVSDVGTQLYVDPEDRRRLLELIDARGAVHGFEARFRRKDGTQIWSSMSVRAVRDESGAPALLGMQQDITEQKRAEEDLRESEARFRSLIALSSDFYWETDAEHRMLSTRHGPDHQPIAGVPQIGKRRWESPSTRPDTEGWAAHRATLDARQAFRDFELAHIDPTGVERHLSISGEPVFDASGGFKGYRGIGKDVTARMQAEFELQRFRMAMDVSVDSIYLTDPATMRFVYLNNTACQRLGYSRERLLQMGPHEVLPVGREQIQREYEEVIAAGEKGVRHERRFVRSDGSAGWTELHRHALRTQGGTLIVTIARDITERKQAEEAVRESEGRFRSLSALSSDWFWQTDAEHRFINTPARLTEITGMTATAYLSKPRWEVAGLLPVSGSWDEHRRVIERREKYRDLELLQTKADGSRTYLLISGEPIYDASGKFTGYRGTGKDITHRKLQEERIGRLTRVHAVLSGINALIVRVQDRDELLGGACRIAVEQGGFPLAWIGMHDAGSQDLKAAAMAGEVLEYGGLLKPSVREDTAAGRGTNGRAFREGKPVVDNDMAAQPDAGFMRSEGLKRGIRSVLSLPLMVAGAPVGVLALYAKEKGYFDEAETKLLTELASDIAFALDHLEKEQRLDYLAFYDQLTGLANRTLFHERLKQFAHSAGTAGSKFALVLADIERLRTINESLGRQAGDAVIAELAERLARSADRGELARIGAGHFAVVFPAVKGKSEIARRVDKLWNSCLSEPFRIEGSELKIAAKSGIAVFPNDGGDAETLLRNAEAALARGKERGESHTFYTSALTEHTAQRLTLENRLRLALEKDEFVLHYQPKVELESRRIVGVEALIRWQNPELGLVPPVQFIPLMEETGLILEAGAWAMPRAAIDHARWSALGLQSPRVAVNVSALQLRQRGFVASVQQAIIEGIAPAGIDLEITESLVMEDIESNIQKLKDVRALGIGLAIDDFGTGYSSLGYLARLPVQTLKIDRSFIITMLNDRDTMTLVQTIVSLAHSLRLKVVAEGVENEEQAKILRLLRCDQMQGNLFSRPVPFEAMTALLEAERKR